jgi:hypothetical protein
VPGQSRTSDRAPQPRTSRTASAIPIETLALDYRSAPCRIAHISKGLIDHARARYRWVQAARAGQRCQTIHLTSLVTIRGAESSNCIPDLTEPRLRHADRECHCGKSFDEGCCSGSRSVPRRGAAVLKKARRTEDTLFPRHRQGDERLSFGVRMRRPSSNSLCVAMERAPAVVGDSRRARSRPPRHAPGSTGSRLGVRPRDLDRLR